MLEYVWRAGAIGPLSLPHRIVMGSMHLGLEGLDDDGEALAAFYRERALGGAALIVTGGSAISRVGAGGRNYSFVNEDADGGKLLRVASAIHDAGGLVLLQLFHAGRYAYEASFGLTPVAPSAVYSRYSRCEPRALSGDEVLETISDFARAARQARELGFDGVEIMGSEGYLIDQFLAPATNLRDDEWGGDAERRMRFALSVAAAVREAGGPGQAVVFRMSGASFVEGGPSADEVLEFARRARGRGRGRRAQRRHRLARVAGPDRPGARPARGVAAVGRAVSDAVAGAVPVIASNRINTVELAESVLAAGDADFVSLARPFLADPEIVPKAMDPASGRPFNVCIACNQACIDRSIFDRRVSCVVNPRAGYELELPAPCAVPGPGSVARVAVVGGGPAGMEAARALAAAGHEVSLFEASDRLGGQFRMACRIPGKEDFAGTIAYFEAELERLGVAVIVGTPVRDAGELGDFDCVVVATGVVPRPIDLPGVDLPHVVSYAELLLGDGVPAGASVAIIGAGGVGVDVAHLISHGYANGDFYGAYGLAPPGFDRPPAPAPVPVDRAGPPVVTLMRRGTRVGERIGPSTRWAVVQELRMAGVEILTGVAYERIEPDAVVIRDAEASSVERRVAADTVVIAAGQEPETALARSLAGAGRPHVVIGGAGGAAELDAERAFREGAEAPAAIARLLA